MYHEQLGDIFYIARAQRFVRRAPYVWERLDGRGLLWLAAALVFLFPAGMFVGSVGSVRLDCTREAADEPSACEAEYRPWLGGAQRTVYAGDGNERIVSMTRRDPEKAGHCHGLRGEGGTEYALTPACMLDDEAGANSYFAPSSSASSLSVTGSNVWSFGLFVGAFTLAGLVLLTIALRRSSDTLWRFDRTRQIMTRSHCSLLWCGRKEYVFAELGELRGHRFQEPSYYNDSFGLSYPKAGIGPAFETESTREVEETAKALSAFLNEEGGMEAVRG